MQSVNLSFEDNMSLKIKLQIHFVQCMHVFTEVIVLVISNNIICSVFNLINLLIEVYFAESVWHMCTQLTGINICQQGLSKMLTNFC